jgi:hypothetical protein
MSVHFQPQRNVEWPSALRRAPRAQSQKLRSSGETFSPRAVAQRGARLAPATSVAPRATAARGMARALLVAPTAHSALAPLAARPPRDPGLAARRRGSPRRGSHTPPESAATCRPASRPRSHTLRPTAPPVECARRNRPRRQRRCVVVRFGGCRPQAAVDRCEGSRPHLCSWCFNCSGRRVDLALYGVQLE